MIKVLLSLLAVLVLSAVAFARWAYKRYCVGINTTNSFADAEKWQKDHQG